MMFPPSEIIVEDGDGYVDLSWGLPVDEGGSLVGTWDLYYDWYCSGCLEDQVLQNFMKMGLVS